MAGNRQRQEIEEIARNANLQKDLLILPKNYTFEIPKTIWKICSTKSRVVALQFPEGLTLYACVIADILAKYTEEQGTELIILGDVTYGACCVDDFTARALGCDLLVHYGHSCLVPIQHTVGIHLLYVFVNIDINLSHFVDTIKANMPTTTTTKGSAPLVLISTIQFVASLQAARRELERPENGYNVLVPQASPLSPGELLGCTSPKIGDDVSAMIYLGDGRFHLESMMIQNPQIAAYQYNPYSKEFTRESYGFERMIENRLKAVEAAKQARVVGLILGTLGRQGNVRIFEYLEELLRRHGKRPVKVLLSEIFGDVLAKFTSIDCWVQVACPRLSIDWGHTFPAPLLTPYELSAALNGSFSHTHYPMDYYAYNDTSPWTNNHEAYLPERRRKTVTTKKHISLRSSAIVEEEKH